MRTYSIGEYMIGLDETRNNMIGRIRRGSRNIVDNYDAGRGMQLSVYGPPDGSLWNSQPWALNAIEGGHWLGGSETTVSPVRTPNNVLSWVSHGVHWATGEKLPYLFEHHVSSINGGKALRLNLSSRYVGGGLLPIPARHETSFEATDVALDFSGTKVSEEEAKAVIKRGVREFFCMCEHDDSKGFIDAIQYDKDLQRALLILIGEQQ